MEMRFQHESVVSATPAAVWKVFSEASQWPAWSGAVTESTWVSGDPWKAGSKLKVSYKLLPLRAELEVMECVPAERVVLKGGTMGITAVAEFTFTAQSDGNTLVRAQKTASGDALFMFGEAIKAPLQKSLELWLEGLQRQTAKA